MKSFLEMVGALGLDNPSDLTPGHIMRRMSVGQVKTLDKVYTYCTPGQFLGTDIPETYKSDWDMANAEKF